MTGSPSLPGLTPRAIHELYDLIEQGHAVGSGTTVTVKSYFMELYNDQLVDLYYGLEHKGDKKGKPPKLDIKLDPKKMVYIKNAEVSEEAHPRPSPLHSRLPSPTPLRPRPCPRPRPRPPLTVSLP